MSFNSWTELENRNQAYLKELEIKNELLKENIIHQAERVESEGDLPRGAYFRELATEETLAPSKISTKESKLFTRLKKAFKNLGYSDEKIYDLWENLSDQQVKNLIKNSGIIKFAYKEGKKITDKDLIALSLTPISITSSNIATLFKKEEFPSTEKEMPEFEEDEDFATPRLSPTIEEKVYRNTTSGVLPRRFSESSRYPSTVKEEVGHLRSDEKDISDYFRDEPDFKEKLRKEGLDKDEIDTLADDLGLNVIFEEERPVSPTPSHLSIDLTGAEEEKSGHGLPPLIDISGLGINNSKRRLKQIYKGEIEAGNDNPTLVGLSGASNRRLRRDNNPKLKRKIGPLKKGALKGYKLSLPREKRRDILTGNAFKNGWITTFKRLNALSVLFKNKPKYKKILESDKKFMKSIQWNFEGNKIYAKRGQGLIDDAFNHFLPPPPHKPLEMTINGQHFIQG